MSSGDQPDSIISKQPGCPCPLCMPWQYPALTVFRNPFPPIAPDDGKPLDVQTEVRGEVTAEGDLFGPLREARRIGLDFEKAMNSGGFPSTTFAAPPPRRPAVRITHFGGPAVNATVYIDGKDVSDHVECVDLTLDASDNTTVQPIIRFKDCELDVTGELVPTPPQPNASAIFYRVTPVTAPDTDETEDAEEPTVYRPGLILSAGLAVSTIPAALAYWLWQLDTLWATILFVFCIAGGVTWVIGTVAATIGAMVMNRQPAECDDDDDD